MNTWDRPPERQSEPPEDSTALEQLADALTQQGYDATLITPAPCLAVRIPGASIPQMIYNTGSQIWWHTAQEIAPTRKVNLAAEAITWALRAHPHTPPTHDTTSPLAAPPRHQRRRLGMLTSPSQPTPDGYPGPAYPDRPAEPDDDTWEIPALPGQQAALEALQWHWGSAYEIGVDDGQWWYRRRDHLGGTETATTPDELRTMIITDYDIMPVPREHHAIPEQAPGQPAPTQPTTP